MVFFFCDVYFVFTVFPLRGVCVYLLPVCYSMGLRVLPVYVSYVFGCSGLHELRRWCEEGYATIQYYDKVYSDWLVI